MNQRNRCLLIGGGLALVSIFKLVDYTKKKKQGNASLFSLLFALFGVVAGIAIALEPERQASKKLTVKSMLNETDLKLIEENISEVFSDARE